MVYGFLLVFFASAYAILYALGRVYSRPSLVKTSYGFAVLEFLSGLGMIITDYLALLWKAVILVSMVAYLLIPPFMWKVVVKFHQRHS